MLIKTAGNLEVLQLANESCRTGTRIPFPTSLLSNAVILSSGLNAGVGRNVLAIMLASVSLTIFGIEIKIRPRKRCFVGRTTKRCAGRVAYTSWSWFLFPFKATRSEPGTFASLKQVHPYIFFFFLFFLC
jgi:hypothetical protein